MKNAQQMKTKIVKLSKEEFNKQLYALIADIRAAIKREREENSITQHPE